MTSKVSRENRSVVLATCFLPMDAERIGAFRRFAAELAKHGGSLVVASSDVARVRGATGLGFEVLVLPDSLADYDLAEHAEEQGAPDVFQAWLADVDSNWWGGIFGRDATRSLRGVSYCTHVARQVLDAVQPSVALFWSSGVFPVSRVWHDVARQLGIPVFCFERGLLPGTWMIDASGMNAQSDLRVHPLIRRQLLQHRSTAAIEAYRRWYQAVRPRKYGGAGEGAADVRARLGIKDRLVLVLGGLDSAGMVPRSVPGAHLNSPGFTDSRDVARAVGRALGEEPGVDVVFKAHPGEQGSCGEDPTHNVRVVRDVDAVDLIQAADVVVAGLTGLAFEVLLNRRPLVLVANSPLQGCGAAHEALTEDELGPAIRKALYQRDEGNQDRADRFLDGLLSHCLYAVDDGVPAIQIAELAEHCASLECVGSPDLERAKAALRSVGPRYTAPATRYAQLYFDTGTGIRQEESVTAPVAPSTGRVEFSIPEGVGRIHALRLDPLNDYAAIRIGGIACIASDGQQATIETYAANTAFIENGIFYFDHNDPQIAFDVPASMSSDLKKVTLNLEIVAYGRAASILARRIQVLGLTQALAERGREISSLHESAVERDGKIASLVTAVSERDARILALNEIAAERDARILALDQIAAERERELARLDGEVRAILTSKSWRLTKPLRLLRRSFLLRSAVSARTLLSRHARRLWLHLTLSAQSRKSLENFVFATLPNLFRRARGHHGFHEDGQAAAGRGETEADYGFRPGELARDQFVPLLDAAPMESNLVKLICFYLPQFHPIPENNTWWGEGFTEWTKVQPAHPQFEGHYQPHVPGELGYYSLLDPQVQRRQVELARLYGIGGFCFYFYWFGGKRLLETPIENYLKDSSLDLPFCLCWANENWSRRWDGLDSEMLIAQQHSEEDDLAFIAHVAHYMRDTRYIRVDGKPLLVVYRPGLLPSAIETAQRWRRWCRDNGIGEIYLCYTQSFETVDPNEYGFDAAIEFPPNKSSPPVITDKVIPLHEDFQCSVYDWRVFVKRSECYRHPGYKLFRGVCPAWDNTARRQNRGTVFVNSTPGLYKRWLKNAIADTTNTFQDPEERFVFINAWNEWAEGAHLEPDARYGYAWLQATREALSDAETEARRRLLMVTHDCHPHGAQFLALGIAQQLARNGYSLSILALGGGRLRSEFSKYGKVVIFDGSKPEKLPNLFKDLRSKGCMDALTSTVVSGSVLPMLKAFGFKVTSLVHELPGVIRAMKQEDNAVRIAEFADRIVFPARLVRDRFAEIAPLSEDKVVVRPQGLLRTNPYRGRAAEAYREVCRRHRLPDGARIVLNVAYLDHRKGADLFVEVARQVCSRKEEAVFIWVGHAEPELERQVRSRIRELDLEDRVLLAGFDPEPLVYYAAASVYALTSREDPFPNVVLESASVGVPVVAFEGTTGAAELIVGQGGKLAKHLDAGDFATKVEELLAGPVSAESGVGAEFSLQRYVLDLANGMNGSPRVSVIVPNYNYARLIQDRLRSICAQTYKAYEIIVLDDASADDSLDRIGEFARETGEELQVHVNMENSGSVFRQWVKGTKLATGDLVWIAEADDIADPGFLAALTPAFRNKGVVLAYCQSRQIDENGSVIASDYLEYTSDISERWQSDHFCEGIDEIRSSLAIKNVIPNVSGVLFRRQALLQALEELGDRLFGYRVAGDWLVYLHVLAKGQLYYCAGALNAHRRHGGSVTSATAIDNHISEVARVQAVAQDIGCPDERVQAQAAEYLVRLQRHFGLNVSKVEDRDENVHAA